MTCPVCGREYEKRLEVSDAGGEPEVREDFEVCRNRVTRHTYALYLHDPETKHTGVVGGIIDGIREVL